MMLGVITRETLKQILKQAQGDAEQEVIVFLEDNQEALLGLPAQAVSRLFDAASADEAYADMQEELYRAMGSEERAEFHRKSIGHMRKSREQVTRMMVLLTDIRDTLSEIGRKAFTTVLAVV